MRRNLLFIQTDQLSANALGYAGCPHVFTPNLDRLAARSINFTNTYCAFPKCVPSRTAWTYGRMPHEVMLPGTELDMGAQLGDPNRGVKPEFRSEEMGHWFSQHGYDCVYAGKWHVEQWGPTESLEPEFNSGFRALCPIHDREVPRVCAEYFGERDPEKPFMMVASFDNPHNICEWPMEAALPWGNLPSAPGIPELPPFPANGYVHPDEPYAVRFLQNKIQARFAFSKDDWRRYRWAYFRLVEQVDQAIGELLEALEMAGLQDTTAIVFTSDHGDMQGAHALLQKESFYEESVHVPYLLAVPGIEPRSDEGLVNNALDTFPTLCDLAGIPVPANFRGRSLADVSPAAPDFIASELKLGFGVEGRMIRSERYKYITFDRGPGREQLFDLQQDPGEMENLATCQTFQTILDQHHAYLQQWLMQTDDPFGQTHYAHPGKRDAIPGDEWN